MANEETRVTYKAVADFVSFTRAVDRAKNKLRELRKEEAALNSETTAGEAKAAAARGKHVGVMSEESKALEKIAQGMDKASAANTRAANSSRVVTTETNKVADAFDRSVASSVKFRDESKRVEQGVKGVGSALGQAEGNSRKFGNGLNGASSAWSRFRAGMRGGSTDLVRFQGVTSQVTSRLKVLQKNLDKLRDWRPRLIPPFIALVPVIGSLLALVNPLVAGFGAIIPVAYGFASSLGTLAGAALGAAPALAGLLSTVFALKTAFSGVGGAFKAFGKTPAGGGGGGGGGGGSNADKQIELTQTEKITRAQEAYRRSIQDVSFAEEDLDDARKDYIKRVQDLQKAVDRAAASQAAAAANSRLAQENYANVLADPGSTKGEKMQAAAGVTDARNDYQDTIDENKQNAKDLADLKKTGINGDRQVIQAQRAVTDAVNSQRDAQIALQNAIKGTTDATTGSGGGASAIDEYNAALAKLSPSARKFVEAIVAMKPELDKLKRTVQEAFFSQFVGDIERLRDLFPPVTSLLSDVAGAAGRVADNFLKMITNDEWTSDIEEFGKEFAPILEDVGGAFLALLDGFRNLTMAATPFLADVASNFKEFSENLRDTLGAARADGSLKKYLEDVRDTWGQWWEIIKNVGKTLMNYSSASSAFGQWLTDGLQTLTESWVRNSEEAKQKGSGYQQWLEDLKPLLKEVKGLFGDFFGYLHDEATDPENIKQFTDLVKILREDVGPAIKRILDALSKSGIGEALAKAVGSILDAIAEFLENGGAEGMSAFFDVISGLAKAAGDFVSALPKPVVKFLTESFAILAALTFVGLNLLIGNLIRLGASKGLFSVLKLLSGGKVKGWGSLFGGLGEMIGIGGKGGKGAKGLSGSLNPGKLGGKAAGELEKGFLKSLGKNALKGLGKGGLFGLITGITTGLGADAIRSTAKDGPGNKDSGKRVGANVLESAGTGAAIGGTVGSIIPGVGTAVGAAAGGVIGGAVGYATSDEKDREKTNQDIGKWFDDNFGEGWRQIMGWWSDLMDDFGEGWDQITGWWNDLIGDFGDGWTQITDWWNGLIQGFRDGWTQISDWWNGLIQGFRDGWQQISDWWDGLIQGFAEGWQQISDWWNGLISGIKDGWDTIAGWWQGTVDRARAVWQNVKDWWQTTVDRARAVWQSVKDWWKGASDKAKEIWGGVKDKWKAASDKAHDIWENVKTGWSNASDKAKGIWDDVKGFFSDAASKAKGGLEKAGSWVADKWNDLTGGGGKKKNSGGIIRRALGGMVPGKGNGDTVKAMLTPGEFVVRKSIVDRIGVDNFQRLNSGLMSFGQMLSRAQQEKPSAPDSQGVSFFAGGGLVPQLSGASAAKMSSVASQQAPVTNDYSMNFGDIIVNNPVAEKASDSLPKSIRRAASLGSLRRDKRND